MARLDVDAVIVDPDFADSFQILRRTETIGIDGRAQIDEAAPIAATGTLYPTGDNRLVRMSDYEHGLRTLTCVTPCRLQMASGGRQPDIVLYRGNRYIVSEVEDYSQFGRGFVVAQLSSIRIIDEPPQ